MIICITLLTSEDIGIDVVLAKIQKTIPSISPIFALYLQCKLDTDSLTILGNISLLVFRSGLPASELLFHLSVT